MSLPKFGFGQGAVHDVSKPVHAGPDDSWHGVVQPGGEFTPEAGRYHLYIGLFCPFAHRANLMRHLKGLTEAIPISIVKPYPKGDDKGWPGWKFPSDADPYPGATPDQLFGSKYLHEVYFRDDKEYKGRYSVPLLWDTKTQRAVNNESAELLRWMSTGFNEIIADAEQKERNLYPEHLRAKIDQVSVWMQRDFNTGVYKAGFAKDQETYEKNLSAPFAALNELEALIHANGGPYVLGKELTELDVRAYATVIRFDTVYVQHFKCDLGTIRGNYPVIHEWLKNLYHNVKGFRETTDFKHIKENYTKSHAAINPLGITPVGPFPDIESGVNLDFAGLEPGKIEHPAVIEYQKAQYK